MNKRLKLESELDVITLEAEKLQKKLDNYVEEKEVLDDSLLLKGGALGIGKMKGGKLISIDGMQVSETKEGLRYISDDRPKAALYTGHFVSDYYKYIVDPYKRSCNQRLKEIQIQIADGTIKAMDVPKTEISSMAYFA